MAGSWHSSPLVHLAPPALKAPLGWGLAQRLRSASSILDSIACPTRTTPSSVSIWLQTLEAGHGHGRGSRRLVLRTSVVASRRGDVSSNHASIRDSWPIAISGSMRGHRLGIGPRGPGLWLILPSNLPSRLHCRTVETNAQSDGLPRRCYGGFLPGAFPVRLSFLPNGKTG